MVTPQTITIDNVDKIETWLENMREALVGQIQRGAKAVIGNSSRMHGGKRVVDWQISVFGVRDEDGAEADKLMALA